MMVSHRATVRFDDAPPVSESGRVLHEDLGIRIDCKGIWYYRGSRILRKELVCLFAQALRRDDAGNYWLVTPTEMGRIEVEDVPFLAVEMFVVGDGRERILSVRTNTDEIATIDDAHPLRMRRNAATGDLVPYVLLDRCIEARLTRSVYYDLVALGEEARQGDATVLGVWSCGTWFPLGDLESP